MALNDEIHTLAEQALAINRTFGGEVWPKQAMKPAGFLSPDKRNKIIDILEKISILSSESNNGSTK
jgi:hypothetical protein